MYTELIDELGGNNMFALGIDYMTGVCVTGTIIAAIFIIMIVVLLYNWAYNFTHDYDTDWRNTKYKKVPKGFIMGGSADVGEAAVLTFLIGLLATGLGSLVWPLTNLVLLILAGLLVTRKIVRIQKKLDQVIDQK